ncbi:putative receptor-like protein kinase [Arachis hypogaea]|nr:putative receptor-like protein kinase [Arachis hypogaea]
MPPSTSAMLREFHGTLQHVQHKLVSIDGNASHSENCFKFTILYAAAFVNQYGPESNGAMSCIFGVYVWYDRKVRRKKLNNDEFDFDPEEQGSRRRLRPNTGSIWFKIDELEKATNNFSTKNFIGRGGFGLVFKGVLSDGLVVAVKRILESDFKGDVEFCNEVEIISNLKHQNLVPLRGCCVVDDDDEKFNDKGSQRFLVYDYMSNGNLEDHLFLVSEQQKLKKSQTWPQRKSIILDVAKGLTYLSCDACVHGDVFIVQIGIRVYPLQGLI